MGVILRLRHVMMIENDRPVKTGAIESVTTMTMLIQYYILRWIKKESKIIFNTVGNHTEVGE